MFCFVRASQERILKRQTFRRSQTCIISGKTRHLCVFSEILPMGAAQRRHGKYTQGVRWEAPQQEYGQGVCLLLEAVVHRAQPMSPPSWPTCWCRRRLLVHEHMPFCGTRFTMPMFVCLLGCRAPFLERLLPASLLARQAAPQHIGVAELCGVESERHVAQEAASAERGPMRRSLFVGATAPHAPTHTRTWPKCGRCSCLQR